MLKLLHIHWHIFAKQSQPHRALKIVSAKAAYKMQQDSVKRRKAYILRKDLDTP